MINSFAQASKWPLLKSRSFCPNPVASYGIPSYADSSIKNSKVWGTSAHLQWWEEQFYYCVHGYETGGIWIPGRFYYYLNFHYISTPVRGTHHPDYVDMDLEWYFLVEQAKAQGKGILAPKARRKGFSEKGGALFSHGVRFFDRYKAGVAAGLQTYSDDFIAKFNYAETLLPPELKMKRLESNPSDIEFGWKEKTTKGGFEEKGSRNHLFIKTMFSNPNLFKGTFMNDCIFEEVGEFALINDTLDATDACFKIGEKRVGTPYLQGTGNKMGKGTRAMEAMCRDAEALGYLVYFVPGKRMYFPYVGGAINEVTKTIYTPQGKLHEKTPNLQHLKAYQRYGVEDLVAADQAIDKELDRLSKLSDKTKWREFKQNYPKTLKDVFIRSAGNSFPGEEINNQLYVIESQDRIYKNYRLEYIRDERGVPVQPIRVQAIPLSDAELGDEEKLSESVMILDEGMPIQGYHNLEVAGIDSYDLDQSLTSKSLGAMVILRQNHSMQGRMTMAPVLLIRTRPRTKEKFYEMCLKASWFYSLYNNVLIDVGKNLIINHFRANGGEGFLARRPLKFESVNSEQMHEFGVALTIYSRPKMIAILQTYFQQHTQKVWFPHLLQEALDFDETTKDSDNDTVDALGIALMQLYSIGVDPVNMDEVMKKNPYALTSWREDANGNMVPEEHMESVEGITDPFMYYVITGKMPIS